MQDFFLHLIPATFQSVTYSTLTREAGLGQFTAGDYCRLYLPKGWEEVEELLLNVFLTFFEKI